MDIVTLKSHKISKMDFKNNVVGSVMLKFATQTTHSVKYIEGQKLCEAVMDVKVSDPKKPGAISFELEIRGMFSINTDAIKEQIHTATAKILFSYAKILISTFSGAIGIKPIIVNEIDFDNQQIIRYNRDTFKGMVADDDTTMPDDTIDGPDGSDL